MSTVQKSILQLKAEGGEQIKDTYRHALSGQPGEQRHTLLPQTGMQASEGRRERLFQEELDTLLRASGGESPPVPGGPPRQHLSTAGEDGKPEIDPLQLLFLPQNRETPQLVSSVEPQSEPVTRIDGVSSPGVAPETPAGSLAPQHLVNPLPPLPPLPERAKQDRIARIAPVGTEKPQEPQELAPRAPHPGAPHSRTEQTGSNIPRTGRYGEAPGSARPEVPVQNGVRETANSRETLRTPEEARSGLSWLEMLEMLPVIAQSLPHVTSLFQTMQPLPVQPTHSPVRQPDDILLKLAERAEFAGLKAPTEIGNLEISLNQGIYGISGVGMAVKHDSVAVVLLGLQHPANEQLAAAGNMLVRELQKHFPNRQIRVMAKEENEERREAAMASVDLEAPVLAVGQREFTDGGRR